MNSEYFDVVVIGAGPGGCACAIHCARHGLKVAIIERHASARERPGETLHPGIEPLLRQLGVAEQILEGDCVRPLGTWVSWQHERSFVPYGEDAQGPWRGFQIPRLLLDSLLLESARALGVAIRRPCQARQVIVQNGRVKGVQTDQHPLYCAHLIDASGPPAWLTRQLGLPVQQRSAALTAVYGYVHVNRHGDGPTEGMFADTLGWYWVADLGRGLYNWTRLHFTPPVGKASVIPLQLAGFAPSGKVRGADVTWRMCERVAGDGYFIVGDAAAVLDPGSSHGVLRALMSGIMAAHGIVEGKKSPALQSTLSQHYRQWLQDWFKHDVAAMRELYQTHPHPPPWL